MEPPDRSNHANYLVRRLCEISNSLCSFKHSDCYYSKLLQIWRVEDISRTSKIPQSSLSPRFNHLKKNKFSLGFSKLLVNFQNPHVFPCFFISFIKEQISEVLTLHLCQHHSPSSYFLIYLYHTETDLL